MNVRRGTDGEEQAVRDGGESTKHAYDQLRAFILDGRLEPGVTLSQVQLANELGVSRTPLREAIRLLQTEGLLKGEPNRRIRVSELSESDLEQLYAMRIALESLAVRLTVPKLTNAELDAIRGHLDEADAALAEGDGAAYRQPHRAFHTGLFRHAGERLFDSVVDLWDHAERYRRLYIQISQDARFPESEYPHQLSAEDHRKILAAAEAGDAALSGRTTAEHLGRTAITTFAMVAPRHDPVAVRAAMAHVAADAEAVKATRGRGTATVRNLRDG